VQADDRAVLLPRQALRREQMSGAILSEYQAEVKTAETGGAYAASQTVTAADGSDERSD